MIDLSAISLLYLRKKITLWSLIPTFKQQAFIEWLPWTRHKIDIQEYHWLYIPTSTKQRKWRPLELCDVSPHRNNLFFWNKRKELIYRAARTWGIFERGNNYSIQFCQILSIKILFPQCHSIMSKRVMGLSSWHCSVLKGTTHHCMGNSFYHLQSQQVVRMWRQLPCSGTWP